MDLGGQRAQRQLVVLNVLNTEFIKDFSSFDKIVTLALCKIRISSRETYKPEIPSSTRSSFSNFTTYFGTLEFYNFVNF